jgi:WD40 repeat protein
MLSSAELSQFRTVKATLGRPLLARELHGPVSDCCLLHCWLLEGHSDSVWSIAFSQDGRLLASGSSDKTIKLWEPATGDLEHSIETESVIT